MTNYDPFLHFLLHSIYILNAFFFHPADYFGGSSGKPAHPHGTRSPNSACGMLLLLLTLLLFGGLFVVKFRRGVGNPILR